MLKTSEHQYEVRRTIHCFFKQCGDLYRCSSRVEMFTNSCCTTQRVYTEAAIAATALPVLLSSSSASLVVMMSGNRNRTERVPQGSAMTHSSINAFNIVALFSGVGRVTAINEPFPRTLENISVSAASERSPRTT